MPETPEELVRRVSRERVLEDLAANHPDELIREIAIEVGRGNITWVEAMNSPTYGPAVDAMAAEGLAALREYPGDPLAEAEETARHMIADVSAYGEIALRPGWERPT